MTWAQFWLKPIVTCGLGQMVAEWQHSPAQQYFCSTDWSVISGVEGGVFSSQFSLFDPQRGPAGWPRPLFLACDQMFVVFGSTVQGPSTFIAPCTRPSYTSPSVGCWLLPPTHSTLSLSFECMASMWCLHLPPWTSHQSPNSVNMRQAAASTLLVLTAWSVCPAASALAAQDVDVELRQLSPEQAVDGFPPFSFSFFFLF